MSATEQTLASQIDAVNEGFASQVPAEALATFNQEQAELTEAGIPAGVAQPGAQLPDGELLDIEGNATSLEQTRAGRPAVVVFYRGAWCPWCNVTLRAYEESLLPALRDQGVALIAVSPQKPDGSVTARDDNSLSYDLLSDPGNQIATELGIVTRPSDDARVAQSSLGLDVPGGNADGTDSVPFPTAVVVDAGGTIRWIDVHVDYTTRTEPADILEAVAALDG